MHKDQQFIIRLHVLYSFVKKRILIIYWNPFLRIILQSIVTKCKPSTLRMILEGDILTPCFYNRYSCIIIMQYQSLHKFTLNSITEQDNVMECFCWRRTVNGEPRIFVYTQALTIFKSYVKLQI